MRKIYICALMFILMFITGCSNSDKVIDSSKIAQKKENLESTLVEQGFTVFVSTSAEIAEINQEFIDYEMDITVVSLIQVQKTVNEEFLYGWLYECDNKSSAKMLYNNNNMYDSVFKDAQIYTDGVFVVITNTDEFIKIIS